jgi:membrane protease subunit HflC
MPKSSEPAQLRLLAEQFRSQGTGEAARINGEKDRELARITPEAFREAEEIRGEADAAAARIYAQAYEANPELYAFLRSLETYEEVVNSKTTLLLGSQSELFGYLEGSTP